MQEQTTHEILSPEEPGTREPVPLQNDTSEAAASKNEADAQVQIPSISRKRPEAPASRLVQHQLGGIVEPLRSEDGAVGTVQFPYSVRSDAAGIFQQMVAQGQYARDPLKGTPLPTGKQDYGTAGEFFATIKLAIAEQTQLSDENSALLTFWVFSTWFQDILPLAPGLAITGWAHQGDVVLRTLRAICYHPILVAGVTSATLNGINWERKPTLLISAPNLDKQMAVLFGSSTCRGYLAFRKVPGSQTIPFDYFSSKAIYVGEDMPIKSVMQNYLHINASPVSGAESQRALPLSDETTQDFQNRLLCYRVKNLPGVFRTDFNASGLSPEITSIAQALGRCIVDAPGLRAELVSLLTPHSQQQTAERLDELGTLAVGAALTLCHQDKDQILVGEIAGEVNRVQKGRGERLLYSPEKVGHRLKKAGLLSRRVSADGNGFVLDHATQVRIHEVAATYGCVGLTDDKENLHCLLCQQNK